MATAPVMVTGATGYVAGRLVERLLQEGYTVHAPVRDPSNASSVKYLNEVAGKASGSIKYFKADLLAEGSYDEAMQGCEVVYHTASPFIRKVKNPQKDLVDPAVKGTRNVLDTCNRTPTVKRVVVTSSCAAIFGDAADLEDAPRKVFTESVWNTTSSLKHQPYSYSKTLAEREAWKIAEGQSQWQLVTVNPSLVLGPGLNPHGTSESFTLMKQLAKGDFAMGYADYNLGVVDVRDLGDAHYLAGTLPNAKGRYIVSGTNTGLKEVSQIVKKRFPEYKISSRKVPKCVLWCIAPMLGMTRKEVKRNIGYPWKADNSKSVKELGMKYRPMEETVLDFFAQLRKHDALKM